MIDVLERSNAVGQPLQPGSAVDEAPARRALHGQIERLERDLAKQFAASWPRKGLEFGVDRVEDARRDLRDRHAVEDANRRLIESMLRHPEDHRWVRVGNADIGEPGCHHWHVVPRLGPIGMLANWWRVKISSGCPLAT